MPTDEEWQTQKRKAYRLVQHSMDRPKSPKETLQQQQTHHMAPKNGNNNKPSNEEWQAQKSKAYRIVQHSMDKPKSLKETLQQQQTHHTGMPTNSALPTSNNFIDLSMQDKPNNQEGTRKTKGNKANKIPE
ncbi:hypothetical protein RDI58_017636 [Solanum bulbocastanum]|uniref:Uncharacterized protein n=1 Tax=Solanum bulbocastanum TaxID=147425 RepID=A0AAN8Y9D5_SOLBU